MRIFSGIQPTGRKHIGNYIGAIVQYVAGQDRGEAIYCIVDLHALTVDWGPEELRERTYDTMAILLAAGLDPARCILFRQSDVAEQSELAWILGCLTSYGDLGRMTQFKDKAPKQRELVSAGLFFYPTLMAADVLAYRANEVPVGDDQRQHLELMRDIAIRFNARFGEILVVPEARIPEIGARIMDLQDPTSKMSTTAAEEGTLYVLDEPAVVERKLKRAVTDSGEGIVCSSEKPGITNLITVLAVVRGVAPAEIERDFANARYGDFKAALATEVVEYLAPVRERYGELRADQHGLEAILANGAAQAREIASGVLDDVRRAIGVGPNG
ncbi:MAG TPA: tryptophan--tRNA ligase [Solirubrobacteraceae bacterium]|nr:tryptophan--tRNA ligase [Solirubrobacteraceae bacterium]